MLRFAKQLIVLTLSTAVLLLFFNNCSRGGFSSKDFWQTEIFDLASEETPDLDDIEPPVVKEPPPVEEEPPPDIEEPPPVGEEPLPVKEESLMMGLFLGNPYAGDGTGNGGIFLYEAARSFRAERTGKITAVRHNNRTLLQSNIRDRCASSPGSVWCTCEQYNLDPYTCGYSLSNSYSVGNGGLVDIEVREADEDNLPGKVIGRLERPYVPMEIADQEYPILSLAEPTPLQVGKVYFLVYRQLNPPTNCAKAGVSPSQAGACSKTSGAIGLNGIYFDSPGAGPLGGPYLGSTSHALRRDKATQAWSREKHVLPWYEVRYEDGVWTGEAYAFYQGVGSGLRTVNGTQQLRQKFRIQDATALTLDGLWVRANRNGSGALSVVLQDDKGLQLAKATYNANQFPQCGSGCGGDWAYVAFNQEASLSPGQTYTATFSAPAGASYGFSTGFPLNYGAYKSTSRNFWSGATIEHSSDNGMTWEKEPNNSYSERDMSLLFTLKGGPKKLD